jgi:hypothetical protein
MTVPCSNCGKGVRGSAERPSYCKPCQRAIALAVDAVASRITSAVLRMMADEVDAAAPPIKQVGGPSTSVEAVS